MNKTYDEQYIELVKDILDNGSWDEANQVRTKYADGESATTISLLNKAITFDNSKDSALLTSKYVAWKSGIKEILWIMQKQSNDVKWLNENDIHYWDDWTDKNQTIGKGYGYQVAHKFQSIKADDLFWNMLTDGKFSLSKLLDTTSNEDRKTIIENLKKDVKVVKLNQMDYLLYQLQKNKYSRRHIINLYNIEDLDDMTLHPCVYLSHYLYHNGKLHLTVNIRGNDVILGQPINVFQYSILHKMVAQVSNMEVGTITFNIDNAHIYSRHLDKAKEQINGELHEQPTVWINPDVTSFYDFTIDDVKVENYKHNGKFKYEIAI